MLKKVPRGLEKFYGTTLDGQNPCFPDCPPCGGVYKICPPPEPLKPRPPPRICPPLEPLPGCYVHKPQPKNFQIMHYPCKYCPQCCDRPCCRHVVARAPCCRYDDPCKAQCFNHPPGMKPSGRYPPDVFRGFMYRD